MRYLYLCFEFREREMRKKKYIHTACLAAMLLLNGCESVFEYHPYDVKISGETGINDTNIRRIEEACNGKDTLRIAVISDSHGWYSDTEDAVTSINGNGKIDFVIHGGDLTDCGTTKEFLWQRNVLQRLNVPYVALIGNHDFLGTGEEAFMKIYGDMDFSFIAGGVKFVCLNTNAMEYNYAAPVPNLNYIEAQAEADADRFSRSVVCMHARPYSDEFNDNTAKSFQYCIKQLPRLMFCISGHDHTLQVDDLFGDGVMYYGADTVSHRSYLLFTITQTHYEYQVVNF